VAGPFGGTNTRNRFVSASATPTGRGQGAPLGQCDSSCPVLTAVHGDRAVILLNDVAETVSVGKALLRRG
jgi:hypothetical protein